jgi:AcrR family transcriptional regulator
LFAERGYEAASIKDILERASVNSGSLYYFFPRKEDLLVAVLEKYKELLWPVVLDPVFARVSDPTERVFAVLEGYRQMLIQTGCRQGCPIGNLALEMSDHHDAVRVLIAENFEGWRKGIRQCLEDAGPRLPADLDRDGLATFILTVMEGGVMQARAHRELKQFDASVMMLRDYFDRLLADGEREADEVSHEN